jgi:hypothetical protein
VSVAVLFQNKNKQMMLWSVWNWPREGWMFSAQVLAQRDL